MAKYFFEDNTKHGEYMANEEHKLGSLEKKWLKFDTIIVDELGYVPFSKTGAELLFQFFSSRYEQASVIITTNLEFSEWTTLLGDEKMTAASWIA